MLNRFFERVRHSFRYKLLLLVLLPLLLFIPILTVFTLQRSYSFAEEQLYHKVHTDINVAKASFLRQQDKYLQAVSSLAESHAFYTAIRHRNKKQIQNQLQLLKVTEGFDFVHVMDLKGNWLFDESVFSGVAKPSPLLEDAVHSGLAKVGLEIYNSAYLVHEQASLARQAAITVESDGSGQQDRNEQRALVARTVYPVRNARGQTIALLEAGVLLNNNLAKLAAIHGLVYGPGTLPEQGQGLISIVLDEVRVASSLAPDKREKMPAPGSRVPAEVRNTVLQQGKTWAGKIDTPGGAYLGAYQPLHGYQNNIIGMLEVGYLISPMKQAYLSDLLLFGLLLLVIVLLATGVAILGARRIFKPIERIAEVIRAQEAGTDLRIGEIKSRDEIGAVARRFDRMLDLLHERNAEIRRAADNLEQQVEARTGELKIKNAYLKNSIEMLRNTRHQLVMAEKFAALGELTAGVAHEINNPTAVILGNMDILVEELSDSIKPVETEVSLIYEQVYRIRNIVEKLLKYSRATPLSLNLQETNVCKLIEDSILLVQHEVERKQARILTWLEEPCQVKIDAQELQQVLINLLINAVHAIDSHGLIEVSSQQESNGDVSIWISDNGVGIMPDDIDRIFDPFYSSKGSQGTGLGLSVSYGLIHRYGGRLEVSSQPGKGSVFHVLLRREPELSSQLHVPFDLYSHESTAGREKLQ